MKEIYDLFGTAMVVAKGQRIQPKSLITELLLYVRVAISVLH